MTKTLIALGTAAMIGFAALGTAGQASAAPASPAIAGNIEIGSAVEKVGKRKRGFHIYIGSPYRYGHGYHYAKPCKFVKVKVWNPYKHRYVWKTRKVCHW